MRILRPSFSSEPTSPLSLRGEGINVARFTARFAADHQHPPDYTAILTYDATRLLIDAIRRAGPNRVRLREALTELSPWAGLAGPIHFDGTGQNVRTNICMATIREGAIVLLEPGRSVCQTAVGPPGAMNAGTAISPNSKQSPKP